jgi:single-strand DNA-binding protein
MSIARAIVAGTLEQDPEQRFTPNNVAVATAWMQVPGRPMSNGQPGSPMRIKLTCWRGMAEQAAQLKKDQVILVEGKLIMPTYQDQSGVQRKHFEVEASTLSVLPGGLPVAMVPVASSGGTSSSQTAPAYATAPVATGGGSSGALQTHSSSSSAELYTIDEDIPF